MIDKANMKLVYSVRQEKDFAVRLNNPAPQSNPFVITSTMYLIVEISEQI